jgi:WD40 repeat protein
MPSFIPSRFALFALFLLSAAGLATVPVGEKSTSPIVTTFSGHTESVYGVAVNADGTMVATASGDKTIRLFEAATGKELRTYAGAQGHQRMVLCVGFSPDGRTLASGSEDNTLKLWDVPVSSPLRSLALQQELTSLVVSPDGTKLAVGGKDGSIKVFDVADHKELMTFSGHTGPVIRLAFSPNSQTLGSAGQDQTVRFWNITNQQPLGSIVAHRGAAQNVAFLASGAAVFSVGDDGLLKQWTLPLTAPRNLAGHKGDILALALSGDGSQVLTGGADRTVRGFTFASGAVNRTLTGPAAAIRSVAMQPAGTYIGAGSDDGWVHLWTAADNKVAAGFLAHDKAVTAVAFQPQNTQYLTGAEDGTVKLWALPAGAPLTLEHPAEVTAALASGDGKKIFTAGTDGVLRSWDVAKKTVERQFAGPKKKLTAVAVIANGQLIVSGGEDGAMRFWNPGTGQETERLGVHNASVTSLSVLPTGNAALSTAADGTVSMWRLPVSSPKLLAHADQVTSVAATPDGKFAVTGCSDKGVRLWNLTTGGKERDFAGPTLRVLSVAISPDGKTVAAGSADNTLYWWNAADAKLLHKLALPSAPAAVALSPDGKHVAAGLADGHLVVADVVAGKEEKKIRRYESAVLAIAFGPKSDVLLSARDGEATQTRLDNDMVAKKIAPKTAATSVALSPDGSRVAWSSAAGIEIDSFDGGPLTTLKLNGFRALTFSRDSKFLALGGADNRVWLSDLDGKLLQYFEHEGQILGAVFADGQRLVTASADKSARLWTPAIAWQRKLASPSNHVQALFSPVANAVIAADGQKVVLLNPADGKETTSLPLGNDPAVGLAMSADAKVLATLHAKSSHLKVWSLAMAKPGVFDKTDPLAVIDLPGELAALAISGDGQRVAYSVAGKPAIHVYDIATRRELQRFVDHQKPVTSLSWQANGRMLVSSSNDKTVRTADIAVQKVFAAHEGGVLAAQYHANGTQVLTAGKDNTAKLWDLTKGTAVKTFGPVGANLTTASFNRDFTQVAAAFGKVVQIWNLADDKKLHTLEHPADVLSLSFNFDKTRLVTGSADKTTRVWDLASGLELQTIPQVDPVRVVAFHNSNTAVLSAGGDKQVTIDTPSAVRVLKADAGPVKALALTPSGTHVLTGGPDRQVHLWVAATGAKERSIPALPAPVQSLTVSKNGVLVAAATTDKRVRVFTFADGKELKSTQVATPVDALSFSANNLTLAAAGAGGQVDVWSVPFTPGQPPPATFLTPLQSFKHAAAATDVAFGTDNAVLFSSGLDKKVESWKLAGDVPTKQIPHPGSVTCLAFHSSGTKVVTGAADGKIRIIDLVKGGVLKEINAHPTPNETTIYAVAFHPKLDQVASAGYDGAVKVWDATTGALIHDFRSFTYWYVELPGHRDNVFCLAFSPDGKQLASGSAGLECLIKIWDLDTGRVRDLINPQLKRAPGFEQSHPGWIYGVRWTADGKRLVSAGQAPGNKGYVAVWDPPAAKLLSAELLPLGALYALELMPGDRTALVGAGSRGAGRDEWNKAYILRLPEIGK